MSKFEIGDRIKVVNGDYVHTKPGTEGEVTRTYFGGKVEVNCELHGVIVPATLREDDLELLVAAKDNIALTDDELVYEKQKALEALGVDGLRELCDKHEIEYVSRDRKSMLVAKLMDKGVEV